MSSSEIARKNDLMRSTFIGCRVVMTEAVSAAPNKEEILSAVRSFKDFTSGNNPYGDMTSHFLKWMAKAISSNSIITTTITSTSKKTEIAF